VLGAPPERYDEYEAQVRREYRRVPWPIFRSRRSSILRGFLERGSIYRTSWFLEHREAQARRNLTHALERLRGRE
jgi:predicted metal-dependent HD superfamily phosphohydrolase